MANVECRMEESWAFAAAKALFKARGGPGQVDVGQDTEGLEVEPLAGGIGGDHQADLVMFEGFPEILALDAGKAAIAEQSAAAGAGIDADRFAGERPWQRGNAGGIGLGLPDRGPPE
jgi:hypothetical protein